jgi:hypothetical protein
MKFNFLRILLFVGLLGMLSHVEAQEETSSTWKDWAGLSGSLRLSSFERDRSFSSDRGYTVGSAWLQSRPAEVWGFRSYLDGRLQGQNLQRHHTTTGDLREAYFERSIEAFDFKVGRQIIVWGKADKINPTDVLTTRDFTLLTTDDEDQRTGAAAAQVSYNFQDYRLIAIWQPEWREPKVPLGSAPAGVTLSYGTPGEKESQGAIRFEKNGGTVDWSTSYARLIDRLPDLKVLSSGATGTTVELRFQTHEMFGADVSTVIGDYGLRGEVAYLKTKDSSGTDPLTKNSQIFGVFGVDRTFMEYLNVNVQYVYRKTIDFVDPGSISNANERLLAETVSSISNQLSSELHGGSLRISYKMFQETLEAEVAAVGWTNNGLLRPKVTYAFNDQFKGILGAEFYGGDPKSFFGRLKDISSGFAEIRYYF